MMNLDNVSRSIVKYCKGGEIMAYSKAQMTANNKYRAKAYDQVNLIIPKGTKETWKTYAAGKGKSLNAYITELVEADMKGDTLNV